MSIRSCLLACSLLAWCSTGVDAGLIRLKSPVSASSGVVRLGDVAEIEVSDPERHRQLSEVRLAPAPLPGRTLRLEFEGIRARLTAVGVPLGDIEFTGTSVVLVNTPDQRVVELPMPTDAARKRLEDLLAKPVQQRVLEQAPQLGRMTVTVKIASADMPLLATAANGKYEIAGGQSPWTGDQLYSVRFTDRDGKQQQVRVNCHVSPYPRVLVAARQIARGATVREEDLRWQQVDKPTDNPAQVEREEALVGLEATRTLRVGEPISRKDVRGIPLVRTGDIVTVMSRRPGIVVRMEAKAQSDGALGESVTLSLLDRRQKLTAIVTGYHEVEVGGASKSDSGNGNAGTAGAGDKREANEAGSGLRVLSERR